MSRLSRSAEVCFRSIAVVLVAVISVNLHAEAGEQTIDFNRDIRPLLSNSCFACHGPDTEDQQGGLRLDLREYAVDLSGVIVPGRPEDSDLMARITSEETYLKMPPPDSNRPALTEDQIEMIRRWIAEGAEFAEHWSYAELSRPEVPAVNDDGWVRNPIDAFVAAGHQQAGVAPADQADRRTLSRRLAFDLTGMPPAPEQVDAFLADSSEDAYSRLVESLLADPRYGERMAQYWLDLVRYADSIGYHSDNPREVSMYRDYVIRAFNEDRPFDRFTIEQIAGDLLPDAGWEQLVASGYNLLLQTTEEGGAQPKEYTAKYAADRVRNVSDVWMGVTLACAECHHHKYDPFTIEDFYSMAAFFADIQEPAVGRRPQTPVLTPELESQQRNLKAAVAEAQQVLDSPTPEWLAAQAEWLAAMREQGFADGELPAEIISIVQTEDDQRDDAQRAALWEYYRSIAPDLEQARQRLADAQQTLEAFSNNLPVSLVPKTGPPRTTRVLPRGNWLDDSGAVVEPAVPELFGVLDTNDRRPNRLDLAQWLIAPDNPLVARTMVNRLWMLFFGAGLSRTVEDLGAQGELPTHPELLDWLAAEYIDSGWDTKHLIRLMVGSAAYQQSSLADASLRQRDPENRLLARQARFRLDAEMVRDSVLAISGLLVEQQGGPSVKPYQPAGYWAHLNFPTREWTNDTGDSLYRRGLYTHWQRTFLHPSLLAFDAPSREECTARRPRSNTPQQALVLLNDPTYVEAARVFAERILREGGADEDQRLDFAFRQALHRTPSGDERQVLSDLRGRHLEDYRQDLPSAKRLLQVGDWPAAEDLDPAELASWTSVARVLLNLPETIFRY